MCECEQFNEFEKYILTVSLDVAVKNAEEDVLSAESKGKRSLFAPGYFTMIGDELREKLVRMTKSEQKVPEYLKEEE